ncbi:hypothetical protein CVT24_001660 [Panaeolus cyanescens]|uniref:Uncharacterized protein n=1 Tax=Panaeolus cyanescens TaxID=181874 RepID=A0A409VSZ3_9AGAR|nr:hypothetical protein CVT24_001660 [Panaeolus cyanescens]
MSCDNTPKFSTEIFYLIIDQLDVKEDLATLKAVALASTQLGYISQSRLFEHVDLPYKAHWYRKRSSGRDKYDEEELSLVDGFLDLAQTSPRIASYVRSISFISYRTWPCLSSGMGLTAAASLIALTKNLTNVWFPITNYYTEEFEEWSEIPKDLQTAFLQLYQKPPSGDSERRFINIEAIHGFPTHLLLSFPRISELLIMPLVRQQAWVDQIKSLQKVREIHALKSLKLYYCYYEHYSFHWVDTVTLLELRSSEGRPAFSFKELRDLDTVCAVDEKPATSLMSGFHPSTMNPPFSKPFTPVILKVCSQTLQNLTLRCPDQHQFYAHKACGSSHVVMPPDENVYMDLSSLTALQSFCVYFSKDQTPADDWEDMDTPLYNTHVPYVGDLLKSLVRAPAFSTTLSSITFTITLGKYLEDESGDRFTTRYNVEELDWSEMTDVLTSHCSRSSLNMIKFKFLAYTDRESCSPLNVAEIKAINNAQLKELQCSTGIVVIE